MHLNYLCGTSSGGWGSSIAKHHAVATESWTMPGLILSMQAGIWCNAKPLKKAWTCMPYWTACQSTHGTACAWWHTSATGVAQSFQCRLKRLWNWCSNMSAANVAQYAATNLNEHKAADTAHKADTACARTRNAAHAVWQAFKPFTHFGQGYTCSSAGISGRKARHAAAHPAGNENPMEQTAGVE